MLFRLKPIISREKFSCQENEEDLQEIRSAYKIVPDKNGRRKKDAGRREAYEVHYRKDAVR